MGSAEDCQGGGSWFEYWLQFFFFFWLSLLHVPDTGLTLSLLGLTLSSSKVSVERVAYRSGALFQNLRI
jgi:hypothetical protein